MFDEYSRSASGRSFSPDFSSISEAGGSAIHSISRSERSFLRFFAISMSLTIWPRPNEPLMNKIFFIETSP